MIGCNRLGGALRHASGACSRAAIAVALLGLGAPAQADDGHRRFSTRDGESGGLGVTDPSTGAPDSVRLQLALDTLPADDFLHDGDEASQSRQALSASWTPAPMLELFASLHNRDTASKSRAPATLHTQSALFGLKLVAEPLGPLRLGGSLRLSLPNDPGGQAPLFKATSAGLRAAAGVDLRDQPRPVPFIGRFNLGYLLDNSGELAESTENARYDALPDPLPRADEDSHLLTRLERYGLGLNRTDSLELGLGVEIPLEVAERTQLHPLLEARLAVPVNRQGYDCPSFADASAPGEASSEDDDCVGDAGAKAWHSDLAVGVRVAPPVRGLSLALALQLGLTGSSHFARELAPNAPFAVTFVLGYDYDPPAAVAVTSGGPLLDAAPEPTPEGSPAPEAPEPAATKASVGVDSSLEATGAVEPTSLVEPPSAPTTPPADSASTAPAPTPSAAAVGTEAPAVAPSAPPAPTPEAPVAPTPEAPVAPTPVAP